MLGSHSAIRIVHACMQVYSVDEAVCLPVRAGISAGSVRAAACNTENPEKVSAGSMAPTAVAHQATAQSCCSELPSGPWVMRTSCQLKRFWV